MGGGLKKGGVRSLPSIEILGVFFVISLCVCPRKCSEGTPNTSFFRGFNFSFGIASKFVLGTGTDRLGVRCIGGLAKTSRRCLQEVKGTVRPRQE